MVGMAVLSAAATKVSSDNMAKAQAKAADANAAEGYRVAQESDRKAQAEAFEAQTDSSRKAAQKLSMARVIAAEGGGSLAARAINIQSAANEDASRIDASLRSTRSSIQGQVAAIKVQNAQAIAAASTAMQANQIRFMSSVAQAGVSYGVDKYKKETEIETAKDVKR